MATDAEAAERQRLIAEINRLRAQIERAIVEQHNLEEELAFLIAAIGALTVAAEDMSNTVTRDVGALRGHISKEEVDARDLLQALRDLSDKYFNYKNLSTATRNLTQYTDEYYTRFEFYHDLRRIALGCIMAVDTNLISHEGARKQVEKTYLANTDYWLAYATTAVMLWWSDEREAAERALRKALVMDERKSSLLFLFCNLKLGRKEVAAAWYAYYLNTIHANDVGEEYQYLLEAYLSGSFGSDRVLESRVGAKFQDMLSEITLYDINYQKDVAESARKFMATKAHVTDFDFFYIPEYCVDSNLMKGLLNAAERHAVVAHELEELAAQADEFESVDEKLEDSIYNLIESMDADEEKVYLRIKRNELVVAARGDVAVAEQAFEERYPSDRSVSLGGLMQRWAFTEDDPRILPEVRRFALGNLAPSIRSGFKQFAESYRALEQERFEVKLGDWSFNCSEAERDIARANYAEHFDKHQLVNYFKDKFVLIWSAMIVVGIVGLVLSAVNMPEPSLIVMSALLVLVGAFLLWRQVTDVKASLQRRKEKDLSIIERTLEEMSDWREAYREADRAYDALVQATYLFEE